MRIIGGAARSRLIDAPKGMDTRPTQDKVRESLFNILQGHVADRKVLDLFAGSGALGLEALSRGAARAVFVDASWQAARVIQGNIERLGYQSQAQVICGDWKSVSAAQARSGRDPFDLVFLDPPYRMTNTGEMCSYLLSSGVIAPQALIVIEHAWETPPRLDDVFEAVDSRRYGDTGITFVKAREETV